MIIHKISKAGKSKKPHYLCNRPYSIKKGNHSTRNALVTCKNCLKKVKRRYTPGSLIPVYIDPRIVEQTKKYTPLIEIFPRSRTERVKIWFHRRVYSWIRHTLFTVRTLGLVMFIAGVILHRSLPEWWHLLAWMPIGLGAALYYKRDEWDD